VTLNTIHFAKEDGGAHSCIKQAYERFDCAQKDDRGTPAMGNGVKIRPGGGVNVAITLICKTKKHELSV